METNNKYEEELRLFTNILKDALGEEVQLFFEEIPQNKVLDKKDFPLCIFNIASITNTKLLNNVYNTNVINTLITYNVKIYNLNKLDNLKIAEKLNNTLLNNRYKVSNIRSYEDNNEYNASCLLIDVSKMLYNNIK